MWPSSQAWPTTFAWDSTLRTWLPAAVLSRLGMVRLIGLNAGQAVPQAPRLLQAYVRAAKRGPVVAPTLEGQCWLADSVGHPAARCRAHAVLFASGRPR